MLNGLKIFLIVTLAVILEACTITSSTQIVETRLGEPAELEWNVETAYNMIFGGIDCNKDGRLVATSGKTHSFQLSNLYSKDERYSASRISQRYLLNIENTKDQDGGSYMCTILCISNKGNYYSQTINLTVTEKPMQNEDMFVTPTTTTTTTSTVDDETSGTQSTKKQILIIAMATTSSVLLVLIVVVLVLCIKKKFYKLPFSKRQKSKEDSQRKDQDFEEQQYADLSCFESPEYNELNATSPLCTKHHYEYVSTSHVKKKTNKTMSNDSTHYEYIDPKIPFGNSVEEDLDE